MQNVEQSAEFDNDANVSINDYRGSDFKVVVDDFVETFEQSKKKKAIKKTESTLELFMGVA
jgi:hypothetical protein